MMTFLTARQVAILTTLLFFASGGRDQDDSARRVLEAALRAHGGKEGMTWQAARKSTSNGVAFEAGREMKYHATIWRMVPTKTAQHLRFSSPREGELERVMNGDDIWQRVDGVEKPYSEVAKKQEKTNGHINQAYLLYPLLEAKEFGLTGLPDQKIDGRRLTGVRISKTGYANIDLYFDNESKLLVMSVTPLLELPGKVTVNHFSDFKKIRGALIPMRTITKIDGVVVRDTVVLDVSPLDKKDEVRFSRPKQ